MCNDYAAVQHPHLAHVQPPLWTHLDQKAAQVARARNLEQGFPHCGTDKL